MSVYVIGAGPAGLMAAITAASNGKDVILIERNEKIGKKLYITGKGRCNVTNMAPFNEFIENVVGNKKFLYSALRQFNNEDTVRIIEEAGIKTKVERGNRVFPESDKSSDIIKAFSILLKRNGVRLNLNERVKKIVLVDNRVEKIITDKDTYTDVSSVVIATGGMSYTLTGSTGDGYEWAKLCGHSVISPVPSLTGIHLSNLHSNVGREIVWEKLPKVQGISLKNVRLTTYGDNREICSEFGEMLFTDKGISGPIVLTTSAHINRVKGKIVHKLDFKPALDEETLDSRIIRDIESNGNKVVKNLLLGLVPSGIVPLLILSCGINGDKKANAITKEERRSLVRSLKEMTFSYRSLEPIDRAVVTAGGINVNEIDPRTMRSKKIDNLFFAGEIIDVDALTGGYNIQIALSTGYCAGKNVTED